MKHMHFAKNAENSGPGNTQDYTKKVNVVIPFCKWCLDAERVVTIPVVIP